MFSRLRASLVLAPLIATAALGYPRRLETDEQRDVQMFYEYTGDRAVWLDADRRPGADARRALAHLRAAPDDGLSAEEYRAVQLGDEASALMSAAELSPSAAAAFDVGLTSSMLRYFRHLHLGRVNPRSLGFHLDHALEPHDFPLLLQSALQSHAFRRVIDGLRPPFAQYRDLKEALKEYRTSDARKAMQIELALERLRWLPDVAGRRLVVVNIPMFEMWAWDADRRSGAPAVEMAAIIGRAGATKSPVFTADLTSIVLNPPWNVPDSIVRGEILPAIRRDPAYLAKHHMEIVESGPTPRIRQVPGPWNALGRIKFDLPNPHGVYLHGTPAGELFKRARRDFSHGCVRLEDPEGLAEWLLQAEGGWPRARIAAEIATGVTRTLTLQPRPLVVVFYMTAARAFDSPSIRFADDVYGHDARLAAWLAARTGGGE